MKNNSNNNVKNLIKILLLVLLTFNLTACTLANKDSAKVQSKDRLIGVFVTEERIDFKKINGNEKESFSSLDELEEKRRLYVEKTLDKVDEDEWREYKYNFKGLDGSYMFVDHEEYTDEEGESYSANHFKQDKMSDTIFNAKDNNSIVLKSTLYLNTNSENKLFSFSGNPMYQDSEGNIYISSANSIAFDNDHFESDEQTAAITRSEKQEINNMGKKSTSTQDIKVQFVFKNPCQSFKVLEMDDKNQIIKINEFDIASTPENFKVPKDTAYLILEESSLNRDNKIQVKRTLLTKKDENFTLYTASKEDSICKELFVNLKWE